MKLSMIKTSLLAVLTFASIASYAEDWTISAQGSCETELGSTVNSDAGLRASGTAIVKCPLTKEVTSSALLRVYARIYRAVSGGADPFCSLQTSNAYGGPSYTDNGYASSGSGAKSVSISIPTQPSTGYADVYCVLNNNDILYGVRYIQEN